MNVYAAENVDCIILDNILPDGEGVKHISHFERETPVILLTGDHHESLGMEAVQSGAQDYLVKGNISKDNLNRSIRYSLERQKLRKKLIMAEKQAFLGVLATAPPILESELTKSSDIL